jgi:hypothetical protein
MDLRSFVSETLVSIAEGVALARRQRIDSPAPGCPTRPLLTPAPDTLPDSALTEVRFDIALTVADEAGRSGSRKAGLNIRLAEGSLGSETASRKRDEIVSRIAFAVPLRLPTEAGPGPIGRLESCDQGDAMTVDAICVPAQTAETKQAAE